MILVSHLEEPIGDAKNSSYLNLGAPHDVNISLELKDWLFALEGAEVMAERQSFSDSSREERSWHTSFESFKVRANGIRKDTMNSKGSLIGAQNYPVEVVKVSICFFTSALLFCDILGLINRIKGSFTKRLPG